MEGDIFKRLREENRAVVMPGLSNCNRCLLIEIDAVLDAMACKNARLDEENTTVYSVPYC